MLAKALLMVTFVASWAQAQGLSPVELAREVRVRQDQAEPWTWHGLPLGPGQALSVPYEIPTADEGACLATALPVSLPVPSAVVYVLFSPVVSPSLAEIGFVQGATEQRIAASGAALVWAAQAPHSRRLLLARLCADDGASITEIRPHGCYVFGVAVGGAEVADDDAVNAAYAEGQATWSELFASEAPLSVKLAEIIDTMPEGSVALIPPSNAPPPALAALANETNLGRVMRRLTPDELVDPGVFSAQSTPVAIYVGGESYLRTVSTHNDGADAVLRYLAEGGTLVIATLGPYPMFYAQDSGSPGVAPVEPLLARAGVDRIGGLEQVEPGWELLIRPTEGQAVFPGLPAQWPYPTHVDSRLRSLGRVGDSACKVTPLIVAQHADGRLVGEVAALFELGTPPGSAGAILHIWGGLLSDGQVNETIIAGLVQWIAGRVGIGEETRDGPDRP